MKKMIFALGLFFPVLLLATVKKVEIKNYKWNGVEVVFVEDPRYPTYTVAIYFADGALSDQKNAKGVTDAMFSLLDTGTRRFNQRELSDNLEYYGVGYGANVSYESSNYMVAGLAKDIVPTMKKICHMFRDAQFPAKELRKEKIRARGALKSLVSDHSALASRAFRELSLSETVYAHPVGVKLKDIAKIKSKTLKNKLNYFNNTVFKKIYLTGPKKILEIKEIIIKECSWNGKKSTYKRTTKVLKKKFTGAKIHLVTVPSANQAQVRIGRILTAHELKKRDLMKLTSGFLGSGFTSKLMQEIRVKRGLSYSARAFASVQKEYGRAGLSSFTKNKTLKELLTVMKNTVASVQTGNFTKEELERARGRLVGGYPFRFEKTSAFMKQLIYLDHIGRDYNDLYLFIDRVNSFSKSDVTTMARNLYDWKKQTIVVVGDKSLLKELKKMGKVKVSSYKNFL